MDQEQQRQQNDTNSAIGELKTSVAVMITKQTASDKDFQEFKVDYKENQKAIIERMNSFAFVPTTDFSKLVTRVDSLQNDMENNYRKKTDGQTIRNIGVAVVTAIAITLATLVVSFVLRGGLQNVQ